MSQAIQGHCLCGETTITIQNGDAFQSQILCHCWDCKHTSGSAFSTNIVAPLKDTVMVGPVRTYETTGASGNPVTRSFCGTCGSALSHRSIMHGDGAAIQTGNFKYFADKPVSLEFFTKDRWSVIAAIEGAKQFSSPVLKKVDEQT
ncbi:Mss4-like protein [Ephemerocybe angulata]|uniref:Mss4-like protein n=1 Tax=Ephemerocybe angulata TaxID=980116 RepID=A0A8H6HE02_9AGAR|nr:Mss4-like protein [Tulosesus angulatus]